MNFQRTDESSKLNEWVTNRKCINTFQINQLERIATGNIPAFLECLATKPFFLVNKQDIFVEMRFRVQIWGAENLCSFPISSFLVQNRKKFKFSGGWEEGTKMADAGRVTFLFWRTFPPLSLPPLEISSFFLLHKFILTKYRVLSMQFKSKFKAYFQWNKWSITLLAIINW